MGTVMTDTTLTRPAGDGAAAVQEQELETAMALMEAEEREQEVTNPLRAGLQLERVPSPCVMVIFGVTGDLTGRKLMPALYDLAVGHPLPEGFSIVGVSHRDWDDERFRQEMREAITNLAKKTVDDQGWEYFARGLFYVKGDFKDPATYTALKERLETIDRERRTGGNHLFYLATAPGFYAPIITNLGESGLVQRQDFYHSTGQGWHRVVVEKPFGHDLASARELIAHMAPVVSERQIYRIDHYLGKETVQNILAFRFANVLFEPVFNQSYVDHIQITAAESIGVEGRGGYYEEAGALRDMVQSHLLQVLTVVTMEPPAFFNGNAVRDEKVKVLRSVVPPRGEHVATRVVRGQYGPGFIGGRPVPSYLEERGVNPDSQTETFVALRLEIDNWRWAGVPFYLRTGKRLPRRVTEIAIEFKKVPHLMFQSMPGADRFDLAPNTLTIRIQPDEGISLRFAAKVPGATTQLRTVRMDFFYGSSFGEAVADAYERLLLDAMLGDPTLFARRDEVEEAWNLMQPILDALAEGISPLVHYEAGTWGPAEADGLIERDGREWRRP
jgi:glucose-6-phosphate 1-dehydrogenase